MTSILAQTTTLARQAVGRVLRGPRIATVSVHDYVREHPERWFPAHPS